MSKELVIIRERISETPGFEIEAQDNVIPPNNTSDVIQHVDNILPEALRNTWFEIGEPVHIVPPKIKCYHLLPDGSEIRITYKQNPRKHIVAVHKSAPLQNHGFDPSVLDKYGICIRTEEKEKNLGSEIMLPPEAVLKRIVYEKRRKWQLINTVSTRHYILSLSQSWDLSQIPSNWRDTVFQPSQQPRYRVETEYKDTIAGRTLRKPDSFLIHPQIIDEISVVSGCLLHSLEKYGYKWQIGRRNVEDITSPPAPSE